MICYPPASFCGRDGFWKKPCSALEPSDRGIVTGYVKDKEGKKKFIKGIEEIGKTNSNSYLEMAVSNVNDYTKYGEYELALDIALDNLYEGSVFLDQEIISFARQAYAKSITSQKELLLEMLTKK